MPWYQYLAYFFGGVFLINSVPHLVSGLSGRRFPSPFAKPPGQGESSPTVNILWGAFNVVVGYLLVCEVGDFHIRDLRDSLVLGIGGLLMAMMLSRAFGRIYGNEKG